MDLTTAAAASTPTQQRPPSVGPKGGPGSRVSLACLPCRSRHVRCDAKKPICDRCTAEGKVCVYAKSRRGGLDRAALAARRNQVASMASTRRIKGERNSFTLNGSVMDGLVPPYGRPVDAQGEEDEEDDEDEDAEIVSAQRHHQHQPNPHLARSDGEMSIIAPGQRQGSIQLFTTSPEDVWNSDSSTISAVDLSSLNIVRDPYIERYYKCFHGCHPCVLPRRYLENFLQDTSRHDELKPLINVMRYVGSLYIGSSNQQSTNATTRQLEELASYSISAAPLRAPSSAWLLAQSHLIFSISLYWQANQAKSRQHMEECVRIALEYRMFLHEFTIENGLGNPVLQECLRRTWWQIYIVDAYYAAMRRSGPPPTFSIEATTELPCEEEEYESGEIPEPKTVEEFGAREFAPDETVFSSFAYLVSAVQSMTTAMTRAQSIASAPPNMPMARSSKVLGEVDSILDGWMLLVPESKKDIINGDGDVDELLFQAFMALFATTVSQHRPFSECHFDALECISSCSTPPPVQAFLEPSESRRIHTAKCVKATESQIRLLACPTRPCAHSPFTVCMLTTGTLSLLAACKYLLRHERLAVARDQIRASMGYHKAMSTVWYQARSNLQEVQAIAREVLAIASTGGGNGKGMSASASTSASNSASGSPGVSMGAGASNNNGNGNNNNTNNIAQSTELPMTGMPTPSLCGADFGQPGLSSDDALSSISLDGLQPDGLQPYWSVGVGALPMEMPCHWWPSASMS